MLNALIALMGGTYEQAKETEFETMLIKRLYMVLEFEDYMVRAL